MPPAATGAPNLRYTTSGAAEIFKKLDPDDIKMLAQLPPSARDVVSQGLSQMLGEEINPKVADEVLNMEPLEFQDPLRIVF